MVPAMMAKRTSICNDLISCDLSKGDTDVDDFTDCSGNIGSFGQRKARLKRSEGSVMSNWAFRTAHWMLFGVVVLVVPLASAEPKVYRPGTDNSQGHFSNPQLLSDGAVTPIAPWVDATDDGDYELTQATQPAPRTQPRRGIARRRTGRGRTPNLVGDLFGGASRVVEVNNTINHAFHVHGNILVGSPGSSTAVLVFERDGLGTFNDFTTSGTGADNAPAPSGDGGFDNFPMAEPLPPNDVPTSPGSTFTYDANTAKVVYTGANATATTAQPGVFMNGDLWYASYSFTETIVFEVPGSSGAAVRRIKVAENNSPIPRDRLYFDYKFFRDVIGSFGDVNRYTFGFEKVFFDELMSVDVRLPFAATLDNDQIANGAAVRDFEFGNLTVILKGLLWYNDVILYSGGLGIAVPTGDDTRLFRPEGTQILGMENEAVHLLPFFATLWTPNERFYLQSFLQLDIDANGNPVRGGLQGGVLPKIGVLQDSTLLFADVSAGYWFFRNPCQNRLVQRIASIFELHYSTTTQDADFVGIPGLTISDSTSRLDVLNCTVGLHFDLRNDRTIMAAMSFPLRNGDDRQFDHEVALLANWYF